MATAAQAATFIGQIAPLIQAEAVKRGYKVCSPIIAQACLESAFGTSSLGYKYHNYFGMKCGSKWQGKSVNMKTKEEYTVGTLTTIRDNFRAYDSMADGVKGYFDFISTARYANLKDAGTPREYLERIKADGYATSSRYVDNNMKVVETYELVKYDSANMTNSANASNSSNSSNSSNVNRNPYREPKGIVRKGSHGNDVRWVQYELNKRGAGLIVDGICGEKTEAAIREFQLKHVTDGLVVDGIAGNKTIAALKN